MNPPGPRWAEGSTPRLVHAAVVALLLKVSIGPTMALGAMFAESEEELLSGGAATFMMLAVMAVTHAAFVLGGIGRIGRLSLSDLGWRTDHPAREVLLGLAGFAGCAAAIVGVPALFGELDTGELVEVVGGYSATQRLAFVSLGVIAAFAEESMFRGYLQPSLIARLGPVGGVLLTALYFDVTHFKLHPLPLISKLCIGVVLGVMRMRDRSLWAPAIAHALIWGVFGLY